MTAPSTPNLLAIIRQKFVEWMSGVIFVAAVDSTSGGTIKIKRVGQASPDGQFYPAASGLAATVVAADKVLCVSVGGTVIVVIKVVTS